MVMFHLWYNNIQPDILLVGRTVRLGNNTRWAWIGIFIRITVKTGKNNTVTIPVAIIQTVGTRVKWLRSGACNRGGTQTKRKC